MRRGSRRVASSDGWADAVQPDNHPCVLVVDDDDNACLLAADALEPDGYVVLTAPDGNTALSLIRESGPDVVLLDLGLPEISGLDVLVSVREFSDLPILILSGRSDEGDRVQGLRLGADDYIVKPCSPRELAARVGAVLRRAHPVGRSTALDFEGMHIDIDAVPDRDRRLRDRPHTPRVRPARVPGPIAENGLHPAATPASSLGLLARLADPGDRHRTRAQAPGQDRGRTRRSAVGRDGSRARLPLRPAAAGRGSGVSAGELTAAPPGRRCGRRPRARPRDSRSSRASSSGSARGPSRSRPHPVRRHRVDRTA